MNSGNLDMQTVFSLMVVQGTGWGLKLIGALAVLLLGRLVAGWTRKGIRKALEAAGSDATLIPFFSSLAYYFILAAVLIGVLGMVGIQTASVIAVLGAAGLAVGLALQGTLANFAAGVMLLLFKPFRVGDYVEAGGVTGSVEAVELFATTFLTPDNVEIIVPNSSIYRGTIKNYAARSTRRNDIVIGISYDDDIGVAIDTIREILAADDRVLDDPEPTVAVGELADSSVNIVVRPWCRRQDYGALRTDLLRTLKERLEAVGCSIPYPQADVHIHQVGGSQAA